MCLRNCGGRSPNSGSGESPERILFGGGCGVQKSRRLIFRKGRRASREVLRIEKRGAYLIRLEEVPHSGIFESEDKSWKNRGNIKRVRASASRGGVPLQWAVGKTPCEKKA